MSRKQKIKKLMTKREWRAYQFVREQLRSGDQMDYGFYMLKDFQEGHEDRCHDGEACMQSRVILVATIAAGFGIETVEQFADLEMIAAKLRQGLPIEIDSDGDRRENSER
jgi:hypothetical protein